MRTRRHQGGARPRLVTQTRNRRRCCTVASALRTSPAPAHRQRCRTTPSHLSRTTSTPLLRLLTTPAPTYRPTSACTIRRRPPPTSTRRCRRRCRCTLYSRGWGTEDLQATVGCTEDTRRTRRMVRSLLGLQGMRRMGRTVRRSTRGGQRQGHRRHSPTAAGRGRCPTLRPPRRRPPRHRLPLRRRTPIQPTLVPLPLRLRPLALPRRTTSRPSLCRSQPGPTQHPSRRLPTSRRSSHPPPLTLPSTHRAAI